MASPARVIRFVDYPVTPWKNGRGTTREVVAVGAGPEGIFGWRLSMAEIAEDAPFSVFAGIERHLAVVAGGPLELVIAGEPRRIEIGGAIATFSGDAVVSARPLEGTVTDLNLMTDPAQWGGSLEMVSCPASVRTLSSTVVVALQDRVRMHITDAAGLTWDFGLDALDCLSVTAVADLTIEKAVGCDATDSVAVLVTVGPRSG